MIFLPFCSIIAAICFNRLVIHDFKRYKQSLIQWAQVILILWVCFGTPTENLLIRPNQEEHGFTEIKQNINWVLNNVPRDRTVATLWNNCGGNIFNNDPQFYWTSISSYFSQTVGYNIKGESFVINLKQHQTPVIAAYEREIMALPDISRNYVLSNYRLLPINEQNNCIWARVNNETVSH
jgi:UDP-N-acetylenolpyruvoylglucosamine reductase